MPDQLSEKPPCGIPFMFQCDFCGNIKCGLACNRRICTFPASDITGYSFGGMPCLKCEAGHYQKLFVEID